MKLFVIEQRKQHLKQRIFKLADVRLPDGLLLLPYQTADLLVTLDIETVGNQFQTG